MALDIFGLMERAGLGTDRVEIGGDKERKYIKPEAQALCYSEICCVIKSQRCRSGIVKKVERCKVFCPDCGHALVWKLKKRR